MPRPQGHGLLSIVSVHEAKLPPLHLQGQHGAWHEAELKARSVRPQPRGGQTGAGPLACRTPRNLGECGCFPRLRPNAVARIAAEGGYARPIAGRDTRNVHSSVMGMPGLSPGFKVVSV